MAHWRAFKRGLSCLKPACFWHLSAGICNALMRNLTQRSIYISISGWICKDLRSLIVFSKLSAVFPSQHVGPVVALLLFPSGCSIYCCAGYFTWSQICVCATETAFRGFVDVALECGLFGSAGELLLSAAASGFLIRGWVWKPYCEGRRRLFGVQKDDEWSDVLGSRWEGRRGESWGTPRPSGPSDGLLPSLSLLSTCGASARKFGWEELWFSSSSSSAGWSSDGRQA